MTVTMNHIECLDLSIIRAQVVQRELAHKYQREDWLPYIWEAMDRLDTSTRELIDAGRTVEAEYWLLCAERFAGVISYRDYSDRVIALGPIF